MIIYEVNLSVNNLIYDDYIKWLKSHISKILAYKGFCKHHLYTVSSTDLNQRKLCVHYYINSLEDLDYYLKNYSEEIRLDGLNLFGDNFTASRRVLSISE